MPDELPTLAEWHNLSASLSRCTRSRPSSLKKLGYSEARVEISVVREGASLFEKPPPTPQATLGLECH